MDVQIPALAEDAHHGRSGVHQRVHADIFFHRVASQARRAKGRQPRMLQREVFGAREEVFIFRVGARPSAFDVIDAEFVELVQDQQLIVGRKAERFALRAVAQRCVEGEDAHTVR